jgi:DNA-binding response OmpR family regulator
MLSRNTVLVIDADPAVRLAATRVLEPAGFTLLAVADTSAALARLAVVSADLVICDVEALTPTGTSAIDAITDIDHSVQILTLFTKQRDTTGMLPHVGNALGKPFTPSELLTKVRRALIKKGSLPVDSGPSVRES